MGCMCVLHTTSSNTFFLLIETQSKVLARPEKKLTGRAGLWKRFEDVSLLLVVFPPRVFYECSDVSTFG